MQTSASRIIEKCGGHEAVAAMAGVHVTRVFRWTYPKERGGTGGIIPHRHQQTLLCKAREQGIALDPADFFE